jgi:hypothetical protein
MEFAVEDASITVFDLSNWLVAIPFDEASGRFYITGMYQDSSGEELFLDYRPPFREIPVALIDSIIYKSEVNETLTLRVPEGEWSSSDISVRILVEEPTFWGWNLRRGCNVTLRRHFNILSELENEVVVFEQCPSRRNFPTSDERRLDDKSEIHIMFETLLLSPSVYTIETEGLGRINNTGERQYLIMVNHPSGTPWLTAKPRGIEAALAMFPMNTIENTEAPLLEVEPTTKEVVIDGPSGKIAVGVNTVITDELSRLVVTQTAWITLYIINEFIVEEDGTQTQRQFLSSVGEVSSVLINGEQLVLTRWNELAPDVQGGVIGAVIGAGSTLLGWLLSTLARRNEEPIQGDRPPIQPPPAIIERQSIPWQQMLLVGFLVSLFSWLWRVIRK